MASPWGYVIGLSFFSFSLSVVSLSSLRSSLVPTRIMGVLGQWCLTSGYHYKHTSEPVCGCVIIGTSVKYLFIIVIPNAKSQIINTQSSSSSVFQRKFEGQFFHPHYLNMGSKPLIYSRWGLSSDHFNSLFTFHVYIFKKVTPPTYKAWEIRVIWVFKTELNGDGVETRRTLSVWASSPKDVVMVSDRQSLWRPAVQRHFKRNSQNGG